MIEKHRIFSLVFLVLGFSLILADMPTLPVVACFSGALVYALLHLGVRIEEIQKTIESFKK